jgi:hypothetical protein
VNFERFPWSELQTILNLFIELGWSKKYDTDLKTYSHLLTDCKKVENNINQILYDVITIPEVKRFLLVHSAFDTDISTHDWLQRYMLELLKPNSSDIEWFLSEPKVPEELLKKFAIFDPEPYREVNIGVIVTYKMWGDWRNGEQQDPIQVTDLDWKKIQDDANKVQNDIKNHGIVELKEIFEDPF